MIPLDKDIDSSNVVMVCFPTGAGGSTLINCLGFSNDACLPNNDMAIKQLDGKITQFDKFSFIMKKLEQSRYQKWNDLGISRNGN